MTEPPFSGTIEFKLAIRAFDERVIRKARAVYTYAPQWPYYNVQSRQECTAELRLDFVLTLLALPNSDRSRTDSPHTRKPYWVPFDQLLTVGVLRTRVYDQLRARIDTEALSQDRSHRLSAGLPVLGLPERL